MEGTSWTETEYLVTGKKDPSENPTGWNGPYLDRWPEKNPWGGAYDLVVDSSGIYLQLSEVPSDAAHKWKKISGSK